MAANVESCVSSWQSAHEYALRNTYDKEGYRQMVINFLLGWHLGRGLISQDTYDKIIGELDK